MTTAAETKPEERTTYSLKLKPDDYDRMKALKRDERLPSLNEAVGCALEAWPLLPRKVRDKIIRDRADREDAEAAAGA